MVLEAEHSNSSIGSDKSGASERFSASSALRKVQSRRNSKQLRRETSGIDIDDWDKNAEERGELLEQFRLALIDKGVAEEQDKYTLLRFLRARDYCVTKAVEMYTNHLKWRKENNIDTIATDFDFTEREAFLGVYPQGYYKTDKVGRPITIQHLGSIDLKRIKEVTTMERMVKYHIQEYERFLKHIAPTCSRVSGRHIDQTFAILDVKGVGLKMLTGEVKKMIIDMAKIDGDHYPETLHKTCIINAPFVFKGIWSIVKTMLAARTVSKVSLVGTKYMEELLKYIDIENIPEYLGGQSKNALVDDAGPWNDPVILNKITESDPIDDMNVVELQSPYSDHGAYPSGTSQQSSRDQDLKLSFPPIRSIQTPAEHDIPSVNYESSPPHSPSRLHVTHASSYGPHSPRASSKSPDPAGAGCTSPRLPTLSPQKPPRNLHLPPIAPSPKGSIAVASRSQSNGSMTPTGASLIEKVNRLEAVLVEHGHGIDLAEQSTGATGLRARIDSLERAMLVIIEVQVCTRVRCAAALMQPAIVQTMQMNTNKTREEETDGDGEEDNTAKPAHDAHCCICM